MPKRGLKTLRHNRDNAESSGISLNFQRAAFSCKNKLLNDGRKKSFIKVTAFIKNPLSGAIQAPHLPDKLRFPIY